MRKISLFLSFLLLSFSWNYAQNVDLCGVWYGHNYGCITSNITEIILIEMVGNYCTATKITGDDCVTAGNITWEGEYSSNVFPVRFQVGAVNNPNAAWGPGSITVINENELAADNGLSYTRATCEELVELKLDKKYQDGFCQNSSLAASVQIPNVFSPNGDGINDAMLPFNAKDIETFRLAVFDRWGNEVFQSNQLENPWNGKYKGRDCIEGVYFWVVNFTTIHCGKRRMKGTITLLR
jgi:gliding motility-associated-like protein